MTSAHLAGLSEDSFGARLITVSAPRPTRELDGDVVLEIAGQEIVLLPERAAFWREAETLLVADTHFGKAATFRSSGLAVPRGTTGEGLLRLDRALGRTAARRLIFLGDFLHARQGRTPGTLGALAAWRERWPRLELVLVRGNHDRHAGDPPEELGIRCVDPVLLEPPFAFAHHPGVSRTLFGIAGHVHPAVRLVGRGRQRARLPCFWVAEAGAVLPAFGDFTGCADIEPGPIDRVFAVAGGAVVPIG